MNRPLVVATRRSALALTQTGQVCATLEQAWPHLSIDMLQLTTRGDQILDVALSKVGGKGLFTQEIETALLEGRADFAVHSMKDMPADFPEGLIIGAVPIRQDPRDVLISKNQLQFEELPEGAKVGTSSMRRALCLQSVRPDLEILPLRGNIDTRLRKLETEGLDGIVLAAAGLMRMGWIDRATQYLSEDMMLPAVGQGALAIECKASDETILKILSAIEDAATRIRTSAERSFLRRLHGGCQVPIGGHAQLLGNGQIRLVGLVGKPDGSQVLRCEHFGYNPEELGIQAAEELLSRGAEEILAAAREE